MKNPDISGLLRTLCIIQNDNAYIVDRSFYDVMLLFSFSFSSESEEFFSSKSSVTSTGFAVASKAIISSEREVQGRLPKMRSTSSAKITSFQPTDGPARYDHLYVRIILLLPDHIVR